MADIAKLSSGIRPADIPERQITTRLGEARAQGDVVRLDPASGAFLGADTTSATSANFYGVLLEGGIAGEYRTAVSRGKVAGFDLATLGYGANVQLSRTTGQLADTTDATTGATNAVVGKVVPATANGAPPFDKILEVG